MAGGVAPPGLVAPPQLVSPGVLSGVAAPPVAAAGLRVLVGFLVTFQNDPSGSFWAIYSGRTQLGRAGGDPPSDVTLADASASSRHATVHADPSTGQAFIEDDGSRNGTFLNEQRLPAGERRQLRDNDRVRVGSMTLVVKLLVS
jgi:pSer/pThr/pTyr-binding forkhead associated (FHA) protein